jgi:hypothetical protein
MHNYLENFNIAPGEPTPKGMRLASQMAANKRSTFAVADKFKASARFLTCANAMRSRQWGLPPPSPNGSVSVTVPSGASAGDTLRVAAPNGSFLMVQVPAGAKPGQVLQVNFPTASPSPAKSFSAASAQKATADAPREIVEPADDNDDEDAAIRAMEAEAAAAMADLQLQEERDAAEAAVAEAAEAAEDHAPYSWNTPVSFEPPTLAPLKPARLPSSSSSPPPMPPVLPPPPPSGMFAITVPVGSQGGDVLTVQSPNGQTMTVKVPMGAQAGHTLHAVIPLPIATPSPTAPPQVLEQTLAVTVPRGKRGGDVLTISAPGGQTMQIKVPLGAHEGQTLHIKVPAQAPAPAHAPAPVPDCTIAVTIPRGQREGDVLMAMTPDGQKVQFTVPRGAYEGQVIHIKASAPTPLGSSGKGLIGAFIRTTKF